MAASKVSLKLLIDTKSHKVLFAESGKEFVDFLFNLLSLPVGTVIKLLSKTSMVGSIANLYQSVESLTDTYLQPNINKNIVLNPKILTQTSSMDVPLLLLPPSGGGYYDLLGGTKKFYMCQYCHEYDITDDSRTKCPSCSRSMTREVRNVPYSSNSSLKGKSTSDDGEGGIVKGVVTYMIMDDLIVTPMSTISSITMLNKFHVKEVGSLEEKVVAFGMDEGLKLLKASLQTKAVLTSVFLGP